MKIVKLHANATCEFCDRQKDELVEVEMDTGKKAKLCFRDLQKIVRLNLKEEPKAKV